MSQVRVDELRSSNGSETDEIGISGITDLGASTELLLSLFVSPRSQIKG